MLTQRVLDNKDEISRGLRQPYLAIENALQPRFAEQLRDELLESRLWRDQDDGMMHERGGQQVANDFTYSRQGIVLGDPQAPAALDKLHRYLNSAATLEWFSEISDRKCQLFEGVATWFRPGDQISKHNDSFTRKLDDGRTQSRAVTFNYWLTKGWMPDFGGRLIWEKPYAEILPSFNTLVLFLPTKISEHWVEPVAEFLTVPRLAISGWFMTTSTNQANRLKLG